MVPSAFLRVFVPLEALRSSERERLARALEARPRPRPAYREESASRRPGVGLLTPMDDEGAEVRVVGGRRYVCPPRTRLRVLAGIVSLRASAPRELADIFVPEPEARRAARELARLRRRDPGVVSPVLQNAWHVPARWYLLFEDGERQLSVSEGELRLSYWASVGDARRRAERAVRTLRGADLAPVAEQPEGLLRWLASFPPAGAVELDYGRLADLFTWDELDDDHSAGDLQRAVEALAGAGGAEGAAELYGTVVGRWADAEGRASLS